MPKVIVLPNPALCPEGATLEVQSGENLGRALVRFGIRLPHACEFNGACSTCHIIVRQGFECLEEPSEGEYDKLDAAFNAGPLSRLACQVKMGAEDITIEIPVYNRNIVGEREV